MDTIKVMQYLQGWTALDEGIKRQKEEGDEGFSFCKKPGLNPYKIEAFPKIQTNIWKA